MKLLLLNNPGGGGGGGGTVTAVTGVAPITSTGGTTPAISTSLATNKLLGRATAGTGAAEEITLGTNLSFTGTTLNAAGGGGTPGGSTTQVQFNDAGAFGGDADLTWNSTTNVLGITGDVNLSDGGTYTTTLQTITPTAARTISLPDATGTVALVAGSSGQLLWNNAGVNAGASTLTYDGSILTTSGRFINSYNAAGIASAPAKAFTGTWFITGTATTTKPHLLIEPTGTTSTGWSTNGTGLGVNAASGFTGNLLDLQVNGTSQLRVSSSGILNLTGSTAGGGLDFAGYGLMSAFNWQLRNENGYIGIGGNSANADTLLYRDAANIFAQRNGTNAQTSRVYNTFTNASNYERLSTTWSSNVCYTKPENAGTGSARLYVPVTGATTVSGLPAAATAGAGARAFVTDANATTFLSTVAGGGANKVPVVSDGTNWLIG
jgi:hypothetical protein